jgi:hypothetical protein
MKSGEPAPRYELKLILDKKRSNPHGTIDVVSESAKWLKSELNGAEVVYQYGACDFEDHYGFAVFLIIRKTSRNRLILELKIAEVGNRPYVFAEVRSMGRSSGSLFPFFGEVKSTEGKEQVLHYLSDFLLSTQDDGV